MADAKGPALPEVAVEDAISMLEEWKMLQPLSLQLATNAVLKSHAVQAARIKELEAERDRYHKGQAAMSKTHDALKARGEALEAACCRQVANIERWLETGEPAAPEEAKSIYEQLKAALRAGEGRA